jgi:hypothetical protein
MISLLKSTYQEDHRTFIFHKLRHVDSTAYKNAIDKQNDFLTNSRAIPIHGISADLMSVIEYDIRDLDGIQSIQRHKNTSTTGRWNVMTTTNHFKSLISHFKQLLPTLNRMYSEETTNLSFPPIGLAFNKKEQPKIHTSTVHEKTQMSLNPAAPVFQSLQNRASPTITDNVKQLSTNSISQTISTCASSIASSCNRSSNLSERAVPQMKVPTEIEIKQMVTQVIQSVVSAKLIEYGFSLDGKSPHDEIHTPGQPPPEPVTD